MMTLNDWIKNCIEDILERRKYEKYISEKADIVGSLCEKRGIILWDDNVDVNM